MGCEAWGATGAAQSGLQLDDGCAMGCEAWGATGAAQSGFQLDCGWAGGVVPATASGCAGVGSLDGSGETHPPSGVVGSKLLMSFAPMVNVAGSADGGPAPQHLGSTMPSDPERLVREP